MLKQLISGFAFAAALTGAALLSGTAAAETRMKLAHANAPDPTASTAAAMSVVFKNAVEAGTNGEIMVDIFPSSQLGKERELVESVKIGIIQGVIISEGTTVSFFPPLEVLGIPYLFPSFETAWEVVDGPFGQELFNGFGEANGLKIIASSPPGGFRNFGTNKEVHSVEDLAGLRIRTMEHPIHQAMVSGLGASPLPVAYAELYDALRSGIVDGFELPLAQILNTKFYEVVKHVIVDQHLFNQEMFMINQAWLDSLPPEHQEVVLRAGREAQIAARGIALITNATSADALRAQGVTIYQPTQEELEGFRAAAQPPALEALRGRVDAKWIDGILAAVAEAEKQ